jgi:hypothetical protein
VYPFNEINGGIKPYRSNDVRPVPPLNTSTKPDFIFLSNSSSGNGEIDRKPEMNHGGNTM